MERNLGNLGSLQPEVSNVLDWSFTLLENLLQLLLFVGEGQNLTGTDGNDILDLLAGSQGEQILALNGEQDAGQISWISNVTDASAWQGVASWVRVTIVSHGAQHTNFTVFSKLFDAKQTAG